MPNNHDQRSAFSVRSEPTDSRAAPTGNTRAPASAGRPERRKLSLKFGG